MAWEYKREEGQFQQLPEGRYRIRVRTADKAISKNGNDMLVLQFDVSGSNQILYHYIVFMPDRPEMTNRMLTQFFDAFKDIPDGDFNLNSWVGKIGACQVKHDDAGRAKLHYFLRGRQADDLPPWKEPGWANTSAKTESDTDFIQAGDSDLPFFE